MGRNYIAHAQEMGNQILDEPIFFQKSSVCLSADPVIKLPQSREIHYELEIVASIGKGGSNIPVKEAWHHVDGLCLGLDLTDRPLQQKLKEKRLPWFLAKSFLGSAVITQFEQLDLSAWSHDFWLTLNGKEVQRGNMDQMVFDVPTLIAYFSSRLPLIVGDLIYTGTPSGVGSLHGGDELVLGLGKKIKGRFVVEE
ncbi:MAG: fumarylacetoacetate hydrolase family protein [Fidelibacterota bacterium]